MAEPHSTAAGIAIGAGIGVTGTIMGAHVDALLLGMFSAIAMSLWLPSVNDRLRAAASVSMSSLLAGYGSPVAAAWLSSQPHGLADGDPLRLLVALLIGAACPAVVPMAITRLQSFVRGQGAQ